MTPHHSAEAVGAAAGLITVVSAGVVQAVQVSVHVPPITIWTYVIASVLGAIGGWMFRGMAPGVSDETDKFIAIVLAAGCGGFFGPIGAVMASHRWPAIENLPMSGVIPVSVLSGMVLPFIFGFLVKMIDGAKNDPDGFFAIVRKLRKALRGEE